MKREPLGLVLWQGASKYDGAPIVALASLHSENEKTGDMVQIWILRADIPPHVAIAMALDGAVCGACPHAIAGERTCYVRTDTAPLSAWDAWKRGRYARATDARIKALFAGRAVRFGAYGDPALMPPAIGQAIARHAKGFTGYTHAWANKWAQGWRSVLMASVESADTYARAHAMGWRTFRVRTSDAPLMQNERICPASEEGGKRVQCVNCLACHGARTAGRADIAIVVHGRKGVAERFNRFAQLTVNGI